MIYLSLVMHSHMPLVLGYGRWPHGESWLYEATTDTYLPLLVSLDELITSDIKPNLTINITPVLAEQLSHPDFPQGMVSYLSSRIEHSEGSKNHHKWIKDDELANLAIMAKENYQKLLECFKDDYKYDILAQFSRMAEEGYIELITSPATHPFLPLLDHPESIKGQLKLGLNSFMHRTGIKPSGIWLPECGYKPGLERYLEKAGVEYFISAVHSIGGEPVGTFHRDADRNKPTKSTVDELWATPYKPHLIEESSVAVFIRERTTALQVWSGPFNYPRDVDYLDYYKKHYPGGNRYWRITDQNLPAEGKEIYDPTNAREKVKTHAQHFVELVQEIGEESGVDNPVIVAPYDTELFGHWWAEGIDWLCEVIELISINKDIEMTTTGDYLKQHPPDDEVQLQCSSWGVGGDDRTWLNEKTEWVNNLIKESEKEIYQTLERYRSCKEDETFEALLEEALRELVFMQASDWTYLMTTGEAEDYSAVRISNHYYAFKRILNILDYFLKSGELKDRDIAFVESLKNNSMIFPHIEPEFWI